MTETESQTASTSTSSEKDRMDATAEATKVLSQGKRNLICGEVPTAVNQFQEACKLLAKAYGETAKECAEAYFYYGQSLLDLARMETGVLGNALQGVPEEDEEASKSADEQFENGDKLDDEEREKLRTEVYDAMSEKEKEEMKSGEEKKEQPEGEKMETDEKGDAKETEEDSKENEEEKKEEEGEDTAEEGETAEEEGDTAEEGEGAEGETGEDTAEEEGKEKEEDADDVSNLQLAWEMLELAKVIYMKEDDKDAKLKTADSYLKLGEVSLETEQYDKSTADFNECLKIQKSVLEPEDRSLAETYYQLGLAYCFNKQYDESIDSYRGAIKVLEDRIAKLSKIAEGGAEKKESDSKEDPVKAAESEIKEIKELLPDMRQKIEDSEEEKKNYEQLKAMAKEAIGFGSSSESKEAEPSKTDSKPASNISHLIRRKRKPEEEEGADQDPKKTKQDGSGDAAVNGTTETEKKKVNGDVVQETGAVAS